MEYSLNSLVPLFNNNYIPGIDFNLTTDSVSILSLILTDKAEYFIIIDKDLKIVLFNTPSQQKIKELLGINIHKGMDILLLSNEQRRPFLKTLYNDIFSGRAHQTEMAFKTNDGKDQVWKIDIKPVRNDQDKITDAVILAKEAINYEIGKSTIEDKRRRLEYDIEQETQGLWDWNIKTGKVNYSKSWVKLFGHSENETSEHIDDWKNRLHPDDFTKIEEDIKKHLASENPFYESTLRLRVKDGSYRWILSRALLLERDENGVATRMVGTHNDISDKKTSEENYKLLFYSNPLPSWIFDLETLRFLEVNDAAIEHYGFSREEFLNMTMEDIHPEENRKQLLENIKRYINQDKIVVNNWIQKKKNGELIVVDVNGILIDYYGRNSRLVINNDITAKVNAEKELKESNERFKTVAKATSDAIYDWDLASDKIIWGEGMQTLFGYKPEEVTMQRWEELVHDEDRESSMKSLVTTLYHTKENFWKYEYRFKNIEGNYCYIFEKGYIHRNENGDPIRMIGAMQDISSQKIKEKALIESNERFDAIMKATHDLIWDWNLETGKIYRDTKGLYKVYGVTDPAAIDSIYNWFYRIHTDDAGTVQMVINNILASNDKNTFDIEYRFKRDDGGYNYVFDRGIIMRNEEGKPIRMIGAAQDMTERKELEQQLLKQELEKQKVISQATIETQEKERSVIGKELHDNVNQVLTTTKLYLELALSTPEMKDELIKKSTSNILSVINEIRQLSRTLMNPSIGDLGLTDAIKDLAENINMTRKLQVKLKAAEDLDDELAENQKLAAYRIIQECINNALKHSSAQNVMIHIKKVEDNFQIVIQDDGIGFNINSVKKGAGLKNIQNRVYLANGTLHIFSAPGKGCKMTINFPITNIYNP